MNRAQARVCTVRVLHWLPQEAGGRLGCGGMEGKGDEVEREVEEKEERERVKERG